MGFDGFSDTEWTDYLNDVHEKVVDEYCSLSISELNSKKDELAKKFSDSVGDNSKHAEARAHIHIIIDILYFKEDGKKYDTNFKRPYLGGSR